MSGKILDFVSQFLDPSILVNIFEAGDEVFPNLATAIFLQSRIMHDKLNTRLESLIESSNAIGRKDQDAVVVFQNSKENRNESIPLEIVLSSFLEKHICFIE